MGLTSSSGGVGRRAVSSIGIVCVVSAVAVRCSADETTSPADLTEVSLESAGSNNEWWRSKKALKVVPNSLALVAGNAHRVNPVISSVGETVTLNLQMLDKDSVIGSFDTSVWSIDFDPTYLSISEGLLVRALAPTPPGSTTPVVVKHVDTEIAAEVDVTVLPVDVGEVDAPGGWPNNEPAGMTRIVFVDGSSKDWRGFGQSRAWTNDNRVSVVNDPGSKHGKAIEKRFSVGDESGWNGLTYSSLGAFRELYKRFVFKVSPNWEWHPDGTKFFYWGSPGRPRRTSPTQFFIYSTGHGQIHFVNQSNSGEADSRGHFRAVGAPRIDRGRYHTIEVLHVANTPGNSDGSLRIWIDGIEVDGFNHLGHRDRKNVKLDNLRWLNYADPRLGELEAFLFWGGQGYRKTVNDWIRLSEVYVSGRN